MRKQTMLDTYYNNIMIKEKTDNHDSNANI